MAAPNTTTNETDLTSKESLTTFLRNIVVDKLKQPEEYLTKLLTAFEENFVNSVDVLVKFHDSRNRSNDFEAFKSEVMVDGKKVPSVMWSQVCDALHSLAGPPSKRARTEVLSPGGQSRSGQSNSQSLRSIAEVS